MPEDKIIVEEHEDGTWSVGAEGRITTHWAPFCKPEDLKSQQAALMTKKMDERIKNLWMPDYMPDTHKQWLEDIERSICARRSSFLMVLEHFGYFEDKVAELPVLLQDITRHELDVIRYSFGKKAQVVNFNVKP